MKLILGPSFSVTQSGAKLDQEDLIVKLDKKKTGKYNFILFLY